MKVNYTTVSEWIQYPVPGLSVADIDTEFVLTGHNQLLWEDLQAAKELNIPVYRFDIGGGVIVVQPGDLFFALLGSKNTLFLSFFQFLCEKLNARNIAAQIGRHNLLIKDTYKVGAIFEGIIQGIPVSGGYLTFSTNIKHIRKICKTNITDNDDIQPSNLKAWGITKEEVLAWWKEFLDTYENK